MRHEMNLHPQPFEKIKQGVKTVEMRLFDERRKNISVGDIIVFSNNTNGEKLAVSVKGIQTFVSFDQLYPCFDKICLGYDENDVAKPSDMLQYYSTEQIAEYGVVAILIEKQ